MNLIVDPLAVTQPLCATTANSDCDLHAAHMHPVRPLRTAFAITSMPVGGAETLLVNLIRRFRRTHVNPSVVCLKERGPLGEEISKEVSVTQNWIRGKFDVGVAFRLAKHFRKESIDAVVTVGAGDKMFWGRIAAKLAGVPVICSALHSTGWPDGVGKLNRCLTRITDAFIGVAKPHGQFLVDFEKFPQNKVVVIPNGVDTNRFLPNAVAKNDVCKELRFANSCNLIGIVAALRPEKNHELFVRVAKRIVEQRSDSHFLIIGDGPQRPVIETLVQRLDLTDHVHLLGNRSDTPRLLAALDLFALTSHNEASPVSILEALSCEVPVVASRVGSISESVLDQWNGYTVEPGNEEEFARRIDEILSNREFAKQLGQNGRQHVLQNGSLDNMVNQYEELLHRIFALKSIG
ncbi:MAG: glycosyltransferase [Pirellula sp.]|jgi:glycosyltransferase involved in cell wall biosynthesis|nr:glycosyltransferase [Pirellula sp.]